MALSSCFALWYRCYKGFPRIVTTVQDRSMIFGDSRFLESRWFSGFLPPGRTVIKIKRRSSLTLWRSERSTHTEGLWKVSGPAAGISGNLGRYPMRRNRIVLEKKRWANACCGCVACKLTSFALLFGLCRRGQEPMQWIPARACRLVVDPKACPPSTRGDLFVLAASWAGLS